MYTYLPISSIAMITSRHALGFLLAVTRDGMNGHTRKH